MGSLCSLCNRQDSMNNVFISGSNAKTPLDVSTLLTKKIDDEDFSLSPVQTPLLTGVNFDITREDQDDTDSSVDDEEIEQLLNEEDPNEQ